MNKQELSAQIQDNKKKLVVLGAVMVFAIYMLWPTAEETEEANPELDAQLDALQETRSQEGGGGTPPAFDGVDNNNISLGGGSSAGADPGVYQTGRPVVMGEIVGFGTKTDLQGEYLISYISGPEGIGYEIDMRDIVGYTTEQPSYLGEGQVVRVYGEFITETQIKAKAIQ